MKSRCVSCPWVGARRCDAGDDVAHAMGCGKRGDLHPEIGPPAGCGASMKEDAVMPQSATTPRRSSRSCAKPSSCSLGAASPRVCGSPLRPLSHLPPLGHGPRGSQGIPSEVPQGGYWEPSRSRHIDLLEADLRSRPSPPRLPPLSPERDRPCALRRGEAPRKRLRLGFGQADGQGDSRGSRRPFSATRSQPS
jgi:hypothetical protein